MRTSVLKQPVFRDRIWPAVLLAAFAILVTVTRRGAETWHSADFGLYIMHARNLVEGIPYAATGYVPNPANNIISPGAYPLGYPLLLTFPYASRGLNMFALELVGCAALVAIVAGIWVLARRRMSTGWALVAALGAGLTPQLIDLRDTISSDLAFTAWVLLALCVHDRARSWPWLILLGVSVFMSEATRSAGIALTAALVGADILVRQPGWHWRMLVVLGGTGAAMLANHAIGADAAGTYLSYFERMNESAMAYLTHAIEDYFIALSHALGFSFGKIGNLIALSAFLAVALCGWAMSMRRGVTAASLFLPASAALLIAFPVRLEAERYLVPLLPLLIYYMVFGASVLAKGRSIGLVAAALFLAAGFSGRFVQINPFAPMQPPAFNASIANELVRLGRTIPVGQIVLASNPRVVALFSGDRASIWREAPKPSDLWTADRRMNARFLLLQSPALSEDERRIARYVAERPDAADLVEETRHFRLYRFRG